MTAEEFLEALKSTDRDNCPKCPWGKMVCQFTYSQCWVCGYSTQFEGLDLSD